MRYVVLGASAAGIHGAETLRKLDKQADIILISEDTKIYSRCILHHYMEGIRTVERLSFVDKDFIEKNNIQWMKGKKAVSVDVQGKKVILSDAQTVIFDKLLIATGSHSFIPPVPGIREGTNVYGFRNLDDCEQIMKQAKDPAVKHIVVMGAGLVGVDAVSGLLKTGKSIYLIDKKSHILSMQLDAKAAGIYQDAYREKGVEQYYNVGVKEVRTDESAQISSIVLDNGTVLPCNLFIVTAGVRANIDFLEHSEIETDQYGLVIDQHGRTNIKDIYGAGDVTGRSPIWPAAVKEGIIAASNMAGISRNMTDFFSSKSTMNFLGIATMSLGFPDAPDESYQVEILSDDHGNYKKIISKDDTIYGAILQGDLSYAGILTQLIKRKIKISGVKKPLFKIDYSDFFHIKDNFEFEYQEEDV